MDRTRPHRHGRRRRGASQLRLLLPGPDTLVLPAQTQTELVEALSDLLLTTAAARAARAAKEESDE